MSQVRSISDHARNAVGGLVLFLCILNLPVFAVELSTTTLPENSAHAVTMSSQSPEQKPRKKIALVLSGGGARGLSHVGVMKALEALRIPVDCIAGTSMGAIAGGSFATGISIEEAQRRVIEADWDAVISGRSNRADVPYFRKSEDDEPYFDFTLTLDKWRLRAPRYVVSVQNIDLFFRELTRAQNAEDFSQLPIPFRAVATDIISGESILISDGSVAEAMRASMTVPGLFPPYNYKGHVLVDGGLAMNLPVTVGRSLCGEGARVIAVNASTPNLSREHLTNFVSIGEQTINIGMQRNLDESLAALTSEDVLITPELTGYSSADFKKVREFIRLGEQATLAQRDKLTAFQVTEAEYADWRQKVQARKSLTPLVRQIEMTATQWVNPAVVKDALNIPLNKPLDLDALHHNIRRIYARGDFSGLSYLVLPINAEEADVMIMPAEKNGRDFVRFGLGLYSDFSGDSNFTALASLRRAWLNRLDAEWRTDIQLGRDTRIESEWYQPASLGSEFFLAPHVAYDDNFRDRIQANNARREYRYTATTVGLEMGSVFGRFGEVRLGIERSDGRLSSDELPGTFNRDTKEAAYTLRTTYDQLDNPRFPRFGNRISLMYRHEQKNLGADTDYAELHFKTMHAMTHDDHTGLLAFEYAKTLRGELPVQRQENLGGIFRLSAYPANYFTGDQLWLARIQAYQPVSELPALIGRGIYAGLSLEAGAMSGGVSPDQVTDGTAFSASAYLAADTLLGPFYVVMAKGDQQQSAVYLALGISF